YLLLVLRDLILTLFPYTTLFRSYLNTEGIAITQGFEKLNARLNIDAKLGDKFKTGLSFNGFTSDRNLLAHDQRDLLRAYSIHPRSEEHTSELQSRENLVCRLLLE